MKNYYKKIIIIKKNIFFRHIQKKFFFVETYNNGKLNNTRTKVNCRKKRY